MCVYSQHYRHHSRPLCHRYVAVRRCQPVSVSLCLCLCLCLCLSLSLSLLSLSLNPTCISLPPRSGILRTQKLRFSFTLQHRAVKGSAFRTWIESVRMLPGALRLLPGIYLFNFHLSGPFIHPSILVLRIPPPPSLSLLFSLSLPTP